MKKRMKRRDMEFAIWYLLLQLESLYSELAKATVGFPLSDHAQEKALAIHLKTMDLLAGKGGE